MKLPPEILFHEDKRLLVYVLENLPVKSALPAYYKRVHARFMRLAAGQISTSRNWSLMFCSQLSPALLPRIGVFLFSSSTKAVPYFGASEATIFSKRGSPRGRR
jgi:hypothetical protein